jgi:hypothetical protein
MAVGMARPIATAPAPMVIRVKVRPRRTLSSAPDRKYCPLLSVIWCARP